MNDIASQTKSRPPLLLIIVALFFPSLITWVFFIALPHDRTSWQQTSYVVGKTLQFALPLIAIFWLKSSPAQFSRSPASHWSWGIVFGGFVGGSMLVAYHLYFRHCSWMVDAATHVRGKVEGLGITTPMRFVLLSLFYSVIHSFLEEYYWRWFVFRQLRSHASTWMSIAISSCGFMAHHILVLATFFGWSSPWTWFFSISVAVGGGVWAWIYERTGRLWNPWLSHLLIDAAIFAIGYDLSMPLWSR